MNRRLVIILNLILTLAVGNSGVASAAEKPREPTETPTTEPSQKPSEQTEDPLGQLESRLLGASP